MSPLDAFERLCVEVIELEAIATAAGAAIDACPPPASGARRAFDRAQALMGSAAEKTSAALELAEALRASVRGYLSRER